jgi:hypothetical protein
VIKRFGAILAAGAFLLGGCAGRTPLDGDDAPDQGGSPGLPSPTGGAPATGGAGGGGPVSLTVLPSSAMVPLGQTLELDAFVRNGAGWTAVQPGWSIDDPSLAKLDPLGRVTGARVGQTTVRAAYQGGAGSCTINVVAQTLSSITVSPSPLTLVVGKTQQMQAIAAYSNGQRLDVTQQGIWTSDNDKVAAVDGSPGKRGLVTASGPGGTAVHIAFVGGVGSAMVLVPTSRTVTSLAIVPANPTGSAGGAPVVLDLVATYSDGSTNTVTNDATFSTDNRNVAQAMGNRIQCNASGSVAVRASYLGQTATTTITCGETALRAVRMLPESTTTPVPVGTALRFSLTAYFTDGSQRDVTNQAAWATDNPKVAIVQTTGGGRGLVTAVGTGTATISATYQMMAAKSQLPVK